VETGAEAGIRTLSLLLTEPRSHGFAIYRFESADDGGDAVARRGRRVSVPELTAKPARNPLAKRICVSLSEGRPRSLALATRGGSVATVPPSHVRATGRILHGRYRAVGRNTGHDRRIRTNLVCYHASDEVGQQEVGIVEFRSRTVHYGRRNDFDSRRGVIEQVRSTLVTVHDSNRVGRDNVEFVEEDGGVSRFRVGECDVVSMDADADFASTSEQDAVKFPRRER